MASEEKTYTTTSGFQILVGSCVIEGNNNCKSYFSTQLNTWGTVQNLGGAFLNFNVTFNGRVYHIIASPDGNGFRGTANDGGPEQHEDSWAATSTGVTAAAGKS